MYDILANEKNSLENEFGLNNIIRPPSCYPDVNSQQTAGNWAEANLESKISVRSQVDATNFITETKANIADLQRTVQELRSKLDEKEQQQNESVKELKRVKLSNHISDIIRVFYNKFVYKFKLNDYVENDDGEIIANDKFYKRLQRETNLAEKELGLKPNQEPIIDDDFVQLLNKYNLHSMLFKYLKEKDFSRVQFLRLSKIKLRRNSDTHLRITAVNDQDAFSNDMRFLIHDKFYDDFHLYFNNLEEKTFSNLIQIMID